MDDQPPPAMRVSEAARAFAVTPKTIRRWIADGRLAAFRVGSHFRVSRAAVDRRLAALR